MDPFGEFLRRLRAIAQRKRLERDLDDELAFHLAMREEEHRRAGLAPQDAKLTARRQFGNPVVVKEQTRDAWLFAFVETLSQDVRVALRSLRRAPGFTLVAILSLGLGIGVTTAMFTLVDTLVLRPVPFRDADQLAFVYMGTNRGGRGSVAPAVLRAWRSTPAFAGGRLYVVSAFRRTARSPAKAGHYVPHEMV